jgi:Na+/H+-translocating membrane pyrophosphatase
LAFENVWLIAPAVAILSIFTGIYILRWVKSQDPGSERARFIGGAIKQGSQALDWAGVVRELNVLFEECRDDPIVLCRLFPISRMT